MTNVLNPIALASRPDSAIHDVGAPDGNGGTVQLEYKTRVVKFDGNKGNEDQQLKNETDPGYDFPTWEIFAVFPLDGQDERYRLFMRREKPRR